MLSKNRTARRIAGLLTALGMLVMSSGVALIVTASPANAATPVVVCHATSSDTNPYVLIVVDDDSTQFTAHLAHRDSPNKKWKSPGIFLGDPHVKGDPKPDLIASYTDENDVFHELDGNITAETCAGEVLEIEIQASVTFSGPTCEDPSAASFATIGDHVTFEVTAGSVAPGAGVTVTATVDDGYTFAGDIQSLDFSHQFAAAPEDCGSVVEPPGEEVSPPTEEETTPDPTVVATPTVVHAGLLSTVGQDDRMQQGLALVLAGMIVMVIAGGLGLVRPDGGKTQI